MPSGSAETGATSAFVKAVTAARLTSAMTRRMATRSAPSGPKGLWHATTPETLACLAPEWLIQRPPAYGPGQMSEGPW